MQIEDIKRWHWVVIALAIGGMMAWSWNMMSPDDNPDGRGTSALEFVNNVARPKTSEGFVWVRQTIVYPAEERIDPTTGKNGKANHVVCAMLTPVPPPTDLDQRSVDQLRDMAKDAGVPNYEKMEKPQLLAGIRGKPMHKYLPKHFTADIPFKVGNVVPKSDTYSIQDYLAETREKFPETVEYRFAWWSLPKAQYALWMGGAVLLIGGVWPSLVNLMIGAGMGRSHREKKDDYDMSRFGKSAPAKKAVAVKAGMSDADAQQLRDMQDQLEKNVSGMEVTPGVPASAGMEQSAKTPTVKQLSGVSDPTATPVTTTSDEPKEYGGEYYPVVKPHHQDEAKKPDA